MKRGAKRQLIAKRMFFARRLGHVRDRPLSRAQRKRKRAALRTFTLAELRRSTRRAARRVRRARARRHGGAPNVPIPAALASIAQCESRGDPRAISAGGTYRGKYQFSFRTWASVGGKGDPAAASETEQDRRAAILYRTGGPGHWPVCGR
ncbi:MAG TPA: transglycosylase family protein [Solirubrobacteraceae bacterium]|nr:transglycosylase family protein [Solirubrobacteraceae bacterium]